MSFTDPSPSTRRDLTKSFASDVLSDYAGCDLATNAELAKCEQWLIYRFSREVMPDPEILAQVLRAHYETGRACPRATSSRHLLFDGTELTDYRDAAVRRPREVSDALRSRAGLACRSRMRAVQPSDACTPEDIQELLLDDDSGAREAIAAIPIEERGRSPEPILRAATQWFELEAIFPDIPQRLLAIFDRPFGDERVAEDREKMRAWARLRLQRDPDPRNWRVDEIAAIIVAARREARRVSVGDWRHARGEKRASLDEYLRVLAPIGVLASCEIIGRGGTKIPCPDEGSFARFNHFPDEVESYLDEERDVRPEDRQGSAFARWRKLDLAAPRIDSVALEGAIERFEVRIGSEQMTTTTGGMNSLRQGG